MCDSVVDALGGRNEEGMHSGKGGDEGGRREGVRGKEERIEGVRGKEGRIEGVRGEEGRIEGIRGKEGDGEEGDGK